MEQQLFTQLIGLLTPRTLAYLASDLRDSLEDWQYYPETAPPEALRRELRQALERVMAAGAARAEAEGLDFAQLLEQARAEQQQDDWRWQREQQVRQNWTSDLE